MFTVCSDLPAGALIMPSPFATASHHQDPAHQKFVAFYLTHVPIKVEFLHPLMLVTFAALSACFAIRMTFVLWQNLNAQLDGVPRASASLANG